VIFVYIRGYQHELYIRNNREYEIGDVITAIHAVYGAEYGAGHVMKGCGGWRYFYELG